jgi:hypothetical protein
MQHTELCLHTGDGVALLTEVFPIIPTEAALIIFHTHTLNQLSPGARRELDATIAGETKKRTIYRLSNDLEPSLPDHTPLKLHEYADGEVKEYRLAYVAPHGDWIEWLGPTPP